MPDETESCRGSIAPPKTRRFTRRVWLPMIFEDTAVMKDGTRYVMEKTGWRRVTPRVKDRHE